MRFPGSPRARGSLACAVALALGLAACGGHRGPGTTAGPDAGATDGPRAGRPPRPARPALAPLADNEVYVYADGDPSARKMSIDEARTAGLQVVDLSDGWAPFIFQDGGANKADPAKPNAYRQTFIDLANDRINDDGVKISGDQHNFLEPFGIPPALSMVRARMEADTAPARAACEAKVDWDGLRAFTATVGYLDREQTKREQNDARRDPEWLEKEIARREDARRAANIDGGPPAAPGGQAGEAKVAVASTKATPAPPATWPEGDQAAAVKALAADAEPKVRARVERTLRGQERQRAVRAAQAFLQCEQLLSPRAKIAPGIFDLPTHEALATWERKNDIFGWGQLGGETLAAMLRPPAELAFDTFKRVLEERVAEAAHIVEDGSTTKRRIPASYKDADGQPHVVPNLIEDHVKALLAAIHVADPDDMLDFLRQHGEGLATLHVAFGAPALPPYYPAVGQGPMELSVEIDRGDVWYDFPFNSKGRPVEQPRTHYPHLTLFTHWRGQRIPLVSWRTTIGSWRSEMHENGKVYYRYKNSDVGPRDWKHIVAGPVWIPPDSTPAKDLLTRKVFTREKGPETVVNTDVMGPGFQSAYGLVMAIHVDRGGRDNQIRTHGSVDYTSIARRFSHGCHRLVNNRAVRLFDFVLAHQAFRRLGSMPLHLKRRLTVDEQNYRYELDTRGYYYELQKPVPVNVTEGRVMGQVKKPIVDYVRKLGVDYEDVADTDNAADLTPPSAAARRAAARDREKKARADGTSPDAAASVKAIGGSNAASPAHAGATTSSGAP
ncbi:MAG TPA: L,D-transpeptidase [Polyangia bacterium]|nr:L,D-transpeptidase [Polyangia bacterium]